MRLPTLTLRPPTPYGVRGCLRQQGMHAPPDADSPSPHPLRGQRVPSAAGDATQATFDEATGPRGRRLRRSRCRQVHAQENCFLLQKPCSQLRGICNFHQILGWISPLHFIKAERVC